MSARAPGDRVNDTTAAMMTAAVPYVLYTYTQYIKSVQTKNKPTAASVWQRDFPVKSSRLGGSRRDRKMFAPSKQ